MKNMIICPHAESCYLTQNYRRRMGGRDILGNDVIREVNEHYVCVICEGTSERKIKAELMEVDCMHLRTLNLLEKIAKGLEGKK